MKRVAETLRHKRDRRGAVSFVFPEARFELDRAGMPVRIVRKYPSDATRTIEQFMLEANEFVAGHCAVQNLPALYRVHDPPPEDTLPQVVAQLWNRRVKASVAALRSPQGFNGVVAQLSKHPEREAMELVLQASAVALGDSEARGKVFVLDMGEPVKIVDLARQMIRLAGLKPEQDVRIEFIGLRPGEKLHDELFYADEALSPTRIPSIRLASPRSLDATALAPILDALADAARAHQEKRVLEILARLVPEFRIRERGASAPSPPSRSRGEGEETRRAPVAAIPSRLEGEG
jgi:hypothetical protein